MCLQEIIEIEDDTRANVVVANVTGGLKERIVFNMVLLYDMFD